MIAKKVLSVCALVLFALLTGGSFVEDLLITLGITLALLCIGAIIYSIIEIKRNNLIKSSSEEMNGFNRVFVNKHNILYSREKRQIAILNIDKKQVIHKFYREFELTTSKNVYVQGDTSYSLLLDETKNRIIIFFGDSTYITESFDEPFENILSCSLLKNGITVTSKSTTRTIGGALVGGALLGGAGAIVGGLSGDSKTEEKSLYRVWINTRDLSKDSKELRLGENASGAKMICDLINAIIDKVDREFALKESDHEEKTQSTSVGDELLRLADLKNMGVLTEEEFLQQKQKILNQ